MPTPGPSPVASEEFETALHRAVEMAGTEEAVKRAAAQAIRFGARTLDAELLPADPSDAHLERAVAGTTMPSSTASFGVAHSEVVDLEQAWRSADAALFHVDDVKSSSRP